MHWASMIFKWWVVVVLVYRAMWDISKIDEPRAPITKKDAMTTVLVHAVWITVVVFFWQT